MIGESDERTLQELARRFQRTLAADREALSPSYGRIGSIAWSPVRVLRRDEKGTVILCRYFGQPTRQQLLGVKTNRRGDAGFSSRAKPGPGHRLMAQSFRDVATQTNDFTLRRTSEISAEISDIVCFQGLVWVNSIACWLIQRKRSTMQWSNACVCVVRILYRI